MTPVCYGSFMSRAWQVSIKTERRVVRGADHLELDLEVMNILPASSMQALLADALAEDGWTERSPGQWVKAIRDVQATVDVAQGIVKLRSAQEAVVQGAGRTTGEAAQTADQRAADKQKDVDDQAAKKLFEAEPSVREALQVALQKVYERALEQKAASMGQVESIDRRENEEGQLELVIKVKV